MTRNVTGISPDGGVYVSGRGEVRHRWNTAEAPPSSDWKQSCTLERGSKVSSSPYKKENVSLIPI